MKCFFVDENFQKFLDDELTSSQREEIIFHIKNCRKCKEKYYDDYVLKLLLEKIEEPEIPDNLADDTYDYIFKQNSNNVTNIKAKKKNKRLMPAIAGCAAAAVVIMALVISPSSLLGGNDPLFSNTLEFSTGTSQDQAVTESAQDVQDSSDVTVDQSASIEDTESQVTIEEEASADVGIEDSVEEVYDESSQVPEAVSLFSEEIPEYEINISQDTVNISVYSENFKNTLVNAINGNGIEISESGGVFTADCKDGNILKTILNAIGIDDNFNNAVKIVFTINY